MAGKEGRRGRPGKEGRGGQDKVKKEREREIEREGGGKKGYNNSRKKGKK
jgi:hypothetical protein